MTSEINYRQEQLVSTASDPMAFPGGAMNQKNMGLMGQLLHSNCHLLHTPIAALYIVTSLEAMQADKQCSSL